ncbi:hypothetical protein ZIOFF_052640 [Zingiber officinale]|uniref:Uncharacterized protein n=1 Tax=Zingiber officinale TaxID=94328 RepID=A0A8J5FMG3_ZINOF|nr:hypothetical protein ZIOFF_052640 [Zingiber officinale]
MHVNPTTFSAQAANAIISVEDPHLCDRRGKQSRDCEQRPPWFWSRSPSCTVYQTYRIVLDFDLFVLRGLTDDLSTEALMLGSKCHSLGRTNWGIKKEDLPKYEEQLEHQIAKEDLKGLKKKNAIYYYGNSAQKVRWIGSSIPAIGVAGRRPRGIRVVVDQPLCSLSTTSASAWPLPDLCSLLPQSACPPSTDLRLPPAPWLRRPATDLRLLGAPASAPPPPTPDPRCHLQKGLASSAAASPSNRLNAMRSAMANSLVRIGAVEGEWVNRALIRPSSHQQRGRTAFQPRPSRLSRIDRSKNAVSFVIFPLCFLFGIRRRCPICLRVVSVVLFCVTSLCRSKVVGFSEDDDSEEIRRSWMVKRKKDFQKMEKVHGRLVNILEGLGLHAGVFSPAEQKQIVDCIYVLQKKGRNGELRERTYSELRKWSSSDNNSVRLLLQLRSATISDLQDKKGNSPGIIRDEQVDPIPPLLNIFGCFAQIKFKLQIFCLMIENKL